MVNIDWLLPIRYHAVFEIYSILLWWQISIQKIGCDALCCRLEIMPSPLFGEDMNITAYVSEVTHDIGIRWTRRDFNTERHNEDQSLMFYGLPFKSEFKHKFTELIGSHTFTFTIHNLTHTDVNKTYKLSYGIDTCEVNLTFVHEPIINDQSAERSRPFKVTMIAGIIATTGTVLCSVLVLFVIVKICRRKRHERRRRMSKIDDPLTENVSVHTTMITET
ncbi:uncharacterized protein LOC134714793 isoform X1 [Mytilus trossulus]|uniref:uncharacterized protein LOC134714793 isoform X1 n=2 Tax=Mytilus trossulus TaxID=6551 RepID=UPI003004DEC0